jgi:hypothetical protein
MTQKRLALALFSLAASGLLFAGACSFTLDTNTTQCKSDTDCQRFTGTVCDVKQRVCVVVRDAGMGTPDAATTADTVPSCSGPSGCFACTPLDESQILSHCTDSTCVPFDNRRLTRLGDDGGLRPLPP